MKTGGTSLRRMLVDAVGPDQVYPNDEDLAARPHGWYPGPKEFVDILRAGQTHGASIFIGHFPFVLRDEFESEPLTVALLREPTARTLSMLKHRKLKSAQLSGATYEELLDHEDFVDRQIREYQTKIFAFDSITQCPDTVNVAFEMDEWHRERAINQLKSVDILGVIEDFQGFCTRVAAITGIELRLRRDNTSALRDPLQPREAPRIDQLIGYDQLLYQRALALTS
jgi:hypothetical protein